MKKLLIYSLALVTSISFYACSDFDLQHDTLTGEELLNKSIDGEVVTDQTDDAPQWRANEKYTKLINSFGTTLNRFGEESPKYPDFYGGAYFSDSGKLTLYIYGDFDRGKEAVTSVIGSSDVEFKKADYSYKYLSDIAEDIYMYVLNEKESVALRSIGSFGVMDKTNSVEVRLIGLDDAKAKMFTSAILDKPGVTFKNSLGRLKLKADLRPGCKASTNVSGTAYGSFAFPAKRISDGTVGMVTSGHVISVGQALYQSGVAVGTCSASQRSGSVDAAFVPINNLTLYPTSNVLCATSGLLSLNTIAPLVGTNIHLEGAVTFHSQGVITGTNEYIIDEDGIPYTNLTSGNYTASHGDSGGITYSLNIATGTRYTAGVNMGGDGTNEYFCKANLVLSNLGLQRY